MTAAKNHRSKRSLPANMATQTAVHTVKLHHQPGVAAQYQNMNGIDATLLCRTAVLTLGQHGGQESVLA